MDWEPPEFAPYPEAYGTVYSVTLWARSPDGGKDEVTVNLRSDGSVRDLIYVYGGRYPFDGSGQEYGAEEASAWFTAAYREQAAVWLLQFSDLVWPGSMDRMEAVRFGPGEITRDGRWIMTHYGDYCNPDGTESFDDPCIVIEVYPEFRLLRYGLGLG